MFGVAAQHAMMYRWPARCFLAAALTAVTCMQLLWLLLAPHP